MIKNLLYSLFLHFLLIFGIYLNFNMQSIEEDKTSEISVSLVSLEGDHISNKTKPNAESEDKKIPDPIKDPAPKTEATSSKKSKKNKVKEVLKKAAKSTPSNSITKATDEDPVKEFKPEDDKKEVIKETAKPEENEEPEEQDDDQEKKPTHEKIDSGAEKIDEVQTKESEEKSSDENSTNLANSIENLALSAREKFIIQSQLKRCYSRAVDETGLESNMQILVKVRASEDGYIDSNLDSIVDTERYNNPQESQYKIAIDNVRRAIDLCSPLRNLPQDKYNIWKEVILEFGKN